MRTPLNSSSHLSVLDLCAYDMRGMRSFSCNHSFSVLNSFLISIDLLFISLCTFYSLWSIIKTYTRQIHRNPQAPLLQYYHSDQVTTRNNPRSYEYTESEDGFLSMGLYTTRSVCIATFLFDFSLQKTAAHKDVGGQNKRLNSMSTFISYNNISNINAVPMHKVFTGNNDI